MPIVLNGSGTVTGISVGGLPDGIVDGDTLATGVGGKIIQVVQVIKKDIQSHTGTSFIDIASFNPSITPTGTNSKIMLDICLSGNSSGQGAINLLRSIGGGSYSQLTDYIGDTGSNVYRTTISFGGQGTSARENAAFRILDTPSYSSGQAVAYKLQMGNPYHSTYITYINRVHYIFNSGGYDKNTISTFTLSEIAA